MESGTLTVSLGADQVLLRQAERLGHRDMVDLVGDQVAVAVVFDQQRPAQPVGITGLGLVEVARIAQVGIVVEIQGSLAGDIVGIEIGLFFRCGLLVVTDKLSYKETKQPTQRKDLLIFL